MFIDTHAHLNFSSFENDLEEVIGRARKERVEQIICVSSNVKDSARAIDIAKKYPDIILAACGIHPHCTDPEEKKSVLEQLKDLEYLIKENEVVAIGECGLDSTEPPPEERKRSQEEQIQLFTGQIKLALKYHLPILIHCNKEYDKLFELLNSKLQIPDNKQIPNSNNQNSKLKGIFHFYSGGKKRLKKFLELENFLFGITGTVTYDEGMQNVVKEIPLDRLVLETDCPFLSPEPYRGQRNEPSYIPLIAKKVAEIKGVSLKEVEERTTRNVRGMLGS